MPLTTTLLCGVRTFLGDAREGAPTRPPGRLVRPLNATDAARWDDRRPRRFDRTMDLSHILLLVVAGVAAGGVNAIAGGGSLITFPTLIATGLPTVDANVTNSVSVFLGYVSSVFGSRADLEGQGRRVRAIVPTSLVGSAAGCALLLLTPARALARPGLSWPCSGWGLPSHPGHPGCW